VAAIALPLNRLRTRAARCPQEDISSRGADRAERAARDPGVIISHSALILHRRARK
jgi:transposase